MKGVRLYRPIYKAEAQESIWQINGEDLSLGLIKKLYKQHPNGFTVELFGIKFDESRRQRIQTLLLNSNIPCKVSFEKVEVRP